MYEKPVLGTLEAMAAMDAMLKEAAKDLARPLAFAIVDDNGELLSYARMDKLGPQPRQIAIKKAYTAARMRADTAVLAERMKSQGRSISEFGDPNLLALQGGVVITRSSDGAVLGAVGVSGRSSQEDEDVAKVGITAMNL